MKIKTKHKCHKGIQEKHEKYFEKNIEEVGQTVIEKEHTKQMEENKLRKNSVVFYTNSVVIKLH